MTETTAVPNLSARDQRRIARVTQALAPLPVDPPGLTMETIQAAIPHLDAPTLGRTLRQAGWTCHRIRAPSGPQEHRWNPPGTPDPRRPVGRPPKSESKP